MSLDNVLDFTIHIQIRANSGAIAGAGVATLHPSKRATVVIELHRTSPTPLCLHDVELVFTTSTADERKILAAGYYFVNSLTTAWISDIYTQVNGHRLFYWSMGRCLDLVYCVTQDAQEQLRRSINRKKSRADRRKLKEERKLLAAGGAECDEQPQMTQRKFVRYVVPDNVDRIVKTLHLWNHRHCLLCWNNGTAKTECVPNSVENQDESNRAMQFAIELEFRSLSELVFTC
jgi:hypothetical protein